MHRSFECSTTESAVVKKQLTGHTAAHGASVQCIQAIETERSPGLPSLMVTTRRRLMPHGTSCSFLQAVTQALHSMPRSASHRNFIPAILDAARCGVGRIDPDEGVLLQLGKPLVGPRLLAAALILNQTAGGEDQREL